MILITFLLISFTAWYISSQLIFQKFFGKLNLLELLHCPKCLGFWVSLFYVFLLDINLFRDLIKGEIFLDLLFKILTAVIFSLFYFYLREGIEKNHQIIVIGDKK